MEVPISADDYSRDVLWRLYARHVPIVSSVSNPGHQHGAAFCVRMALEYAGKCGYDNLVVTAEDVLPRPRAVDEMLNALLVHDYAGEAWGVNRDEANAQFFACRTQALVPAWDHCKACAHGGWIERYLRHLLEGHPCRWFDKSLYRHTHDKAEWTRWRDEQGGI
jgi:hypothetical protein